MSYTYSVDIGDGVKTIFPFSFAGQDEGYLSVSNVQVFVSGTSVPFTIPSNDPNKVYLTSAPPVGAEVLIRRIMPKDVPFSDFSRGNPFSQDTLNDTNLQMLYVIQEILDGFLPDGFYFKGDLNMGGHKIVNMAPGDKNGDAVNWEQLQVEVQRNDEQDQRLEAIESSLVDNVGIRTVPYYYIATGGETRWQLPLTFQSAILYINGVFQNQNLGAFSISENGFNFAEPLVNGDQVYALLGSGAAAPDDYATHEEAQQIAEGAVDSFKVFLASNDGASSIGTSTGLTVEEALSVGRVVYPEMFGVGLANPTDDDLFSSMFTALEAKPDTLLGTSLPYTIQLRGKVYTLKQSHQLDINVNIVNGVLLMDGGQIILSREAVGERTRRVRLEDLKVRYVGTTYYPDALIKVSRAYNSAVINCDFWAGDTTATVTDTSSPYFGKPLRARYGLWLGSRRAWGAMIFGGEYFGGEIPCRIGYTNDHTGLTVTGGATFHHGWVGNLLLCNPAGFFVGGVNIEHSENGAWGLCVTSGTNADAGSTVINPAQNGVIHGVYAYNNGNGSTGSTNTPAAVMVGYDAPGTMGFDYPGSLITSQNTAHSISISEVYAVSPKQDYAIKVRGLEGLYVDNNKVTCSVAGRAIHFDGTCARSHAYDNRNQSTGVIDEVTYSSTNKPMIGSRAGTFAPSLTGSTTAGSISYSTRGGNYEISNDNCKLSLWMTLGTITTQPAGNLSISLPVAIASGNRSGGGVHCQVLLGNQTYTITGTLDEDASKTVTSTLEVPNRTLPVTCSITSGTTLNLFLGGLPMDGSVVRDTTDIRLSINYPVAGAVQI